MYDTERQPVPVVDPRGGWIRATNLHKDHPVPTTDPRDQFVPGEERVEYPSWDLTTLSTYSRKPKKSVVSLTSVCPRERHHYTVGPSPRHNSFILMRRIRRLRDKRTKNTRSFHEVEVGVQDPKSVSVRTDLSMISPKTVPSDLGPWR